MAHGLYSNLGIVSDLGGFIPGPLQTNLLWQPRGAAAMLAAIWVLEAAPIHQAVLAVGRFHLGVFCTQLIFCSGHLVFRPSFYMCACQSGGLEIETTSFWL